MHSGTTKDTSSCANEFVYMIALPAGFSNVAVNYSQPVQPPEADTRYKHEIAPIKFPLNLLTCPICDVNAPVALIYSYLSL